MKNEVNVLLVGVMKIIIVLNVNLIINFITIIRTQFPLNMLIIVMIYVKNTIILMKMINSFVVTIVKDNLINQ